MVSGGHAHPVGTASGGLAPLRGGQAALCHPFQREVSWQQLWGGEGITTQRSTKVERAGPRALPSLPLGCPCLPVPSPGLVTALPACPLPPPSPPGRAALPLLPIIVSASQLRARLAGSGLRPRGALSENVTGIAICHPNRAGSGGWEGRTHLPAAAPPPPPGSAGAFLPLLLLACSAHPPSPGQEEALGQRERSP